MQLDPVTLLINGKRYGGWKEITIERGVDRCVSSFDLAVSERFPGQDAPWPIQPFDAVQVYIDADLILTGRVESYIPAFLAKTHGVRITGHSLTKQLVDCTPDIPSGQFNGYTVAAIARSIAAIFGIKVVVQTTLADEVVANTNLERCETAFTFLERLGRLAGVLLCDDENGNLVLTTAGATKCSSALVQGKNVLGAHATYTVAKMFSDYILKGQAGIHSGSINLDGAGGIYGPPAPSSQGSVQTQMRAVAHDDRVPLYRPTVKLAESQMSLAQMQARVNWMKQYAYGQATKGSIKVLGFRQADKTLWRINQIVSCTLPWLGITSDMLIVKIKLGLRDGSEGHMTELEIGPVEGYTPDPGEVKLHKKKKGHAGGGLNLSGAGGIP